MKGFVEYSNKRPKYKDFCESDIPLKVLAFVKDEVWKYESEFRIISFPDLIPSNKIDSNGLNIYCEVLKKENIKKIVLGARSSKILEKRIVNWASNYAKNVKLKKAVPCTDTFQFFYDDL